MRLPTHKLLLALLLSIGLVSFAGGAFALTVTDQVKINELRIDATEINENLGEYVELYNAGSTTVYLDGAILSEEAGTGTEGVWKFPGTVGGTTIPMAPGQFILIVPVATGHTYAGLADFEARGNQVDDPSVPDLTNINGTGTTVMALANSGDDIHLYTGTSPGPLGIPCGECVDGLSWGTGGDFGPISSTVCTDPLPATIGGTNDGKTIGRCADGNDSNVNSKVDCWLMDPTPKAANQPVCVAPSPVFLAESRTPCVPFTSQAATVQVRVLYSTGANISYKVNGGSVTTAAMSMVDVAGDTTTFQSVLPAQATNATLVEYFCRAFNANPDTTQGYNQGYFVGTKTIQSLYVSDGVGKNVYYKYGVRLTGNVTAPYGLFSTTNTEYYVQDATGGINVFKYGAHTVQPGLGDNVTLEGVLDQYNGKLEISSGAPCDTLLVNINGPGAVPAPRLSTTCEDFETFENRLVKSMLLKLPAGVDTLKANSNYKVTNCYADTVLLFIDIDTGIAPLAVTGYQYLTVTGIATQYDSSNPYTSGYEIIPRYLSDIEFVASTGIEDRNVRPMAQLLQNAPNPFGRSTEIRYQVPAGAKAGDMVPVTINVFDIRGRLVKTLVEGLQSPGDHVISLNGDALSNAGSGIYFYRLETGGQVLTRRLLFLEQ